MIPPGLLATAVLAVGAVVGGLVAWRWVRRLAGWLPRRALLLHLAAGPCMVLGTIPVVLGWWAWRARAEAPPPGEEGVVGPAGEVVVLVSLGGLLWLAGLRCLLEGHRIARAVPPAADSPRDPPGPPG